ncbi:MAG: hypothetical protein ACYTFW_25375 [Planctomycetota bacterium]
MPSNAIVIRSPGLNRMELAERLLCIRRTFIKALCASPLGFLVPKKFSIPLGKQTGYMYWRMPTGRTYKKHTCGGASLDFLRDIETWNHETHKWEKGHLDGRNSRQRCSDKLCLLGD